MKKAFTMIELIFVIVVIGILSAIAIPKLAATRDDAEITKARTAVAALRSAVTIERQKNILRGVFTDINGSAVEASLDYPLDSDWSRTGDVFTYTGPSSNTCVFNVSGNKFVKGTCGVSGLSDL